MFGWKLWQQIPSSGEQRSLPRRIKRFAAALGQPPELRYLRWIGIFDREWREALYTDEFKTRIDGTTTDRVLLDAYEECPDRDFVTRTTLRRRADVSAVRHPEKGGRGHDGVQPGGEVAVS